MNDTIIHRISLHRRGPALWPEVFSLALLLDRLKTFGSALFQTVYQGVPAPEGGALFHAEWWRDYAALPPLVEVGQAWDTAVKGGAGHDYSCGITAGCDADGVIYLLDVWRGQVETPELVRRLTALAECWHPHWILVEDAAAGAALLPLLRARRGLPLIPVKPGRSKLARAAAVTPTVEGGAVRLPVAAPWREDFLAELTAFPNGAHDDQVDAFTYLITRFTTRRARPTSEWPGYQRPEGW